VQATRASRPDPLTHAQAVALVTRDRFQLSYWDAAILEAGRSLGCDVVLSEDLGDGQDYDGVRVENPCLST
jgi:predicted nucleic acid-binding protein